MKLTRTEARHEGYLSLSPAVHKPVIFLLLLLVLLQITCGGLCQSVSTNGAGSNLKLPATSPRRLL